LAANLTNVEQYVLAASADNFGQYGVEINKISGLTVSLPEEVQKAVDTRSQMQVLGVNYMQYQAGQAMDDAAKNPSGGAGVTAGLGAGLGVGYAVGGAMAQGMAQGQMTACPNCSTLIPVNSKFCPNCGAEQTAAQPAKAGRSGKFCPNCGKSVGASQKFCPNCGQKL